LVRPVFRIVEDGPLDWLELRAAARPEGCSRMKSRRPSVVVEALLPSAPLCHRRFAREAGYFMFGKSDLSEHRYGMFTQSCRTLSR
jgi:hypothetical protein